jgi:Outer membrane protein beta-barrel domain
MRFLLVALLVVSSFSAFAQDTKFALGGGLTLNKMDVDGDLGDFEEEIGVGLNVGARVLHGFNEQWSLRTGAYLQEKAATLSLDKGGIDGELSMRIISAAIPLNAQFKANENISIFGGYVLDYNINEYCNASGDFDSCTVGETKQIVHHANLGVSVLVNDKVDIDVSYQHGLSEQVENLKIHTLLVQGLVKF